MNIGILGSGMVAQQLGLGFLKSGHEVKMGTGHPEKLTEWLKQAGARAGVGSFIEAAEFGERVVIATKWLGTEAVLDAVGPSRFRGKIVIDVTNPLKFGAPNQPPELAVSYPDSSGLRIQRRLPDAKVVKAFNIINAYYMANPRWDDGAADLFICGNDAAAKKAVTELAAGWGWQAVHDLGGIEQSYLLESLVILWVRWGLAHNQWTHAFKLLKK